MVTAPERQTLFVDTEQLTDTNETKDPQECEEERILAVIPIYLSNTEASHYAADRPQAHEDSSLPFLKNFYVPSHSDVGTGPTGKSMLRDKTSITKIPQEDGNQFCICSKPNENGECEADDGGMMNDGEPATTIKQLKAALKTESKALSALYSELEEERSASAVAANQTMAMITRLQEEKAAMQMEALQYQRMMEEQSEDDQEALQLLNELMNKLEREKQELEKELEIYQKKVLDYEAKEKIRDCVKQMCILDDTFAGFQEERFTILDQLKALEDRLLVLSENENYSQDDKLVENDSNFSTKNIEENHNFCQDPPRNPR
ncbi:hypothetical protein ACLB2K_004624 [Fragaria x ananassa]